MVGTTFIQPTVGLTDDYGPRDNMSSNLHSSNLTMSAITIGYRFNFKNH
ncbi:MAG: hypothetical protein KBT33_12690 [Prevotellaceae bacterium]|nr:hypothetical protein [Candidatus Minthosoma equi]